MGPVAPAGVANPARRVLPNRRIGDLLLSSCCSGNAPCVKGLAVWQIAWYQQGIACRTSRRTALRGRAACSTWPLTQFDLNLPYSRTVEMYRSSGMLKPDCRTRAAAVHRKQSRAGPTAARNGSELANHGPGLAG